MHRSPSRHAFTLIEMITVIAIIAILSGLVLSLANLVKSKENRAKTDGEIQALKAACEAYRTDNGGYPQDVVVSASQTDVLDPREHFNPTDSLYQKASLFLYKQLTGDDNANGRIDAAETSKKYAGEFFKPSRFDVGFKTSGIVSYIADPYGYSYGYSTAGLKAEQDYRVKLEKDSGAARSEEKGFNPTFDLWSTAGSTGPKGSGTDAKDLERNKWIKNW